MAAPTTINSVQDLVKLLGASSITKQPHAHLRVWFRGHSDKSWKLEPGVYRADFPATTESERIVVERHLAQDFRVMSAGIRTGEQGEAELYFLQQHYRMWTRLLDWSNNALAGLYFAVSSHPDKDGDLFMMDAYRLGPCQKGKFTIKDAEGKSTSRDFEGIADTRHPVFQDALHRIFWWSDTLTFPGFIIPVRPDYFDRRITLQRGCFTFHVPDHGELTEKENDTLMSYIIPQAAKADIQTELGLLGIDDFSIFGDLDHLSERLKQAYRFRS
jgi:hypothetical protein